VFGTQKWDQFRSAWERAVERARLVDFHFYDLRHVFASWAVQRGASLQEVKDLLGHHSLATTLRYDHRAPEHPHSAVACLDTTPPASDSPQASAQEGLVQGALL
jgi:integrase